MLSPNLSINLLKNWCFFFKLSLFLHNTHTELINIGVLKRLSKVNGAISGLNEEIWQRNAVQVISNDTVDNGILEQKINLNYLHTIEI